MTLIKQKWSRPNRESTERNTWGRLPFQYPFTPSSFPITVIAYSLDQDGVTDVHKRDIKYRATKIIKGNKGIRLLVAELYIDR